MPEFCHRKQNDQIFIYVGVAASTKKKAEINAARTALLAIQCSGLGPNNSGYTVVPMKKVTDLAISNQESAARTKKKAEINDARTALLPIQSSGLGPNNSGYTVIPMKKVTDLAISNQESAAALKPKKSKLKKKQKRKVSDGSNQVRMMQMRG